MIEPAGMDLASLQSLLDSVVAPWIRELGLRVTHAQADAVHLSLPITAHLVHGGGVLCGQTMMSAADTAMVLAVASQLGGFKPMTTVQLQTSFLRPISGNDTEALVIARVLRRGKSLVFGEIEVQDAQGRLAAHSTTTYALL
jgi:uncharacterized protein (TIGR00369 family)